MSQDVRTLQPQALWNHFADLNEVPRPSKKEERVIEFMRGFGESLNLETIVDDVGNVIIRKPASASMGDRTPIVMQSHLDMVHQKNADTNNLQFRSEPGFFTVQEPQYGRGTALQYCPARGNLEIFLMRRAAICLIRPTVQC